MSRGSWLLITISAVAGVLLVWTINVLTVLVVPEWIKFVIMLVVMAIMLVGSYGVLFMPTRRR